MKKKKKQIFVVSQEIFLDIVFFFYGRKMNIERSLYQRFAKFL